MAQPTMALAKKSIVGQTVWHFLHTPALCLDLQVVVNTWFHPATASLAAATLIGAPEGFFARSSFFPTSISIIAPDFAKVCSKEEGVQPGTPEAAAFQLATARHAVTL